MSGNQHFSIKDLEHLSGVKAHTIRAWELRYGLLQAKRTTTNIRVYSNDDLKQLLNIAILNKSGFKISKIAKMPAAEISKNVLELTSSSTEFDKQLDSMVISMLELNELRFEQLINRVILQKGLESCMLDLLYPFLEKVGILWSTSGVSPAHEHFVTNIIRQKLIVAIDGQTKSQDLELPQVMLFLPEGEQHELSLLFLCYLLKSKNAGVIYLGCNVPIRDLKMIIAARKISCAHTIITSPVSKVSPENYFKRLVEATLELPVTVSGIQVEGYSLANLPRQISLLRNQEEVMCWVDTFV